MDLLPISLLPVFKHTGDQFQGIRKIEYLFTFASPRKQSRFHEASMENEKQP